MDFTQAPPSVACRIGWQSPAAVPEGHRFNGFLEAAGGRLRAHGLEFAAFFEPDRAPASGLPAGAMPSPLEIAFLPNIRAQVAAMERCFHRAIDALGYPAPFHFAFASKANTAEEIVRSTLTAGAHHEMSSDVDVEIARRMMRTGLLPRDRLVLANGFKGSGSAYARNLLELRREHPRVVPILEDVSELGSFAGRGVEFDFGIRFRRLREADGAGDRDSRFGIDAAGVKRLAAEIERTPGARFVLLHAMFGSAGYGEDEFVAALEPGLDLFARLGRSHGHLRFFDFGGGVPGRTTLDHKFDYDRFARLLLEKTLAVCARRSQRPPALIGEFGRYTVSEHAAHLFRVIAVKANEAGPPWYLIDGSIMTSFPDTWALGEHFICLPLNHLDRPFDRVRLGGITCDRDDVYPPRGSAVKLFLPEIAAGELDETPLYVGFFSVGAYQEMLGGVRGSKHCVLPEATELLIDDDGDGRFMCDIVPGHTTEDVLDNLGYGRAARVGAPRTAAPVGLT
ncbi:MAG: arginine decarboxylase [Acidobacteria bacterium]|nr:arginine decarboxylase [Acidobacteriota bacterium]